jgi:uncharacterized protein (DUF3820 family)
MIANRMPFGRYEGTPFHSVPVSYLRWAVAHCRYMSSELRQQLAIALADKLAGRHPAKTEKGCVTSRPVKPAKPVDSCCLCPECGHTHDRFKAGPRRGYRLSPRGRIIAVCRACLGRTVRKRAHKCLPGQGWLPGMELVDSEE